MKKILLFLSIFCLALAACKKPEFMGNNSTGEALGPLSLVSPSTGDTITLNIATPTKTIIFNWTAATPGVETAPTYKWVASLKGGNIDSPLISIPSGDNGKATSLSLTQKQLDSLLGTKGIAAGATTNLIWSIVADNGSVVVKAASVNDITIQRFQANGILPFVLLGPVSSTTQLNITPSSTTDSLKFNWTKAISVPATTTVQYAVYFYIDGFTVPLFSTPSNASGVDSVLTISQKDFSDSLIAHGITDLTQIAQLKWTVAATAGNVTEWSDYTNQLYLIGESNFYIVGNFTPNGGWDINNPLKLIVDKAPGRYGNVFYSYIKLNAGDQFKFFKTPGDWGSGYGDIAVSGDGFSTGFNQGGNFTIPSSGIYRLTIDLSANMAYVQPKQVGVVGSVQTPNQWDPTNAIYGGYLQKDKFLIIVPTTASDAFKFNDGTPAWDNSAPDKSRYWGSGPTAGVLSDDNSSGNLTSTFTPYTRLFWDGTNPQQITYSELAGGLYVIGDATQGGWDNNAGMSAADRPPLTYQGNGIWKGTVTLPNSGAIKFIILEGNWDFSYGVGSTPGSITSDNGGNISISAGTYTITVDEYNQTYTIQ